MKSSQKFGLVVSGITSAFMSTTIITSSYIPKAQAASVNLVYNGSFDLDSLLNPNDATRANPYITGWFNSTANEPFYSTYLENYTVDNIEGGSLSVHIGPHYIDGPGGPSDPITDFTYISQFLKTEVGQKYELSYYVANSAWDLPSEFRTYVGGKLLNTDTLNIPYQDFKEYKYDFVATSNITELKFSGKQASDWFNLDNVSVKPVPEPLTLGGTAIAGLLGLWLKRKQAANE